MVTARYDAYSRWVGVDQRHVIEEMQAIELPERLNTSNEDDVARIAERVYVQFTLQRRAI